MNTDLLVIGGGIAGITAAVEAAEVGKEVVLVEQEHWLGGRVVQMHKYFPKLCPPMCGLEINFRRIRQNPKIKVLTGAKPTKIDGDAGNFTATISIEPRYVNENCTACGDCEKACTVEVSDRFNFGVSKVKAIHLVNELAYPYRYFIEKDAVADPAMKDIADSCEYKAIDLEMQPETVEVKAKSIIWATGWQPYDAAKIDNLGYGTVPNVITNMNMERMASAGGPSRGKITRPSDDGEITRAAFVQCAGSRDEKHLPYCSTVCCMASLKQSRYIREQYPDAEIHIFFIDARTPGRWEDFLQEVEEDEKTIIHRGKVAKIVEADGGMITLTAENTLTGSLEQVTVDLAVLATGMVPNAAADKPPVSLTQDEFGFIENNGGSTVIATGVAVAPKDVAASNEEATGAVIQALQMMVEK
ncbi:CoB--CoM heterodisulfide reductase iron-sulfur subunit A family protein [bacterium]|nr:CoB--CoM heterodisulfide reductase iron-sulfur subunit A family protein [bacterium]